MYLKKETPQKLLWLKLLLHILYAAYKIQNQRTLNTTLLNFNIFASVLATAI